MVVKVTKFFILKQNLSYVFNVVAYIHNYLFARSIIDSTVYWLRIKSI